MNRKVCPMYMALLKSSMMYWTCLKWASSICTIALLISSSLIYTTFCRKRFPQASLLTCAHQRLWSDFSYLPTISSPHLSSFIHLFSSVSLPLLLFHLPSVHFCSSLLSPSLSAFVQLINLLVGILVDTVKFKSPQLREKATIPGTFAATLSIIDLIWLGETLPCFLCHFFHLWILETSNPWFLNYVVSVFCPFALYLAYLFYLFNHQCWHSG